MKVTVTTMKHISMLRAAVSTVAQTQEGPEFKSTNSLGFFCVKFPCSLQELVSTVSVS